ncbi:RDD family protein [Pseudomonas benzenivorans]|uniref:RDD family protein n=1 Tax=Pseudomonas benzenivorans TaxID=556533 RepID=A0ABY5HAU5_9PSED|nr:RDD family protein [Pseudomonas benzenivorans]UTW09104.1 RDD family protein [Pseudomonas benzenivorans]
MPLFSATCPPAAHRPPLDTRYPVETPEGIDLNLRPAGLVPRALAFSIDLAIRGLLLAALFILLGLLGQFGMGLATILLFLVTWWYMVLFEVLNQGRSPGKQLLGLRVVHDDGTPVGWAASLTRNLLRVVDLLPFAYTLGILSCLNHPAFKRLGDLAAGTLVVYRDTPPAPRSLPHAEPVPAPIGLSLSEQRALLAFAERAEQLSSARRGELAALLAEPLQVPPEQAEQRLHGIARGLLGPT